MIRSDLCTFDPRTVHNGSSVRSVSALPATSLLCPARPSRLPAINCRAFRNLALGASFTMCGPLARHSPATDGRAPFQRKPHVHPVSSDSPARAGRAFARHRVRDGHRPARRLVRPRWAQSTGGKAPGRGGRHQQQVRDRRAADHDAQGGAQDHARPGSQVERVATAMRDNATAMDKLVQTKRAIAPASMTAVDDLMTFQEFTQAPHGRAEDPDLGFQVALRLDAG